jgi:hypothetical protein
MNTMEEQYNPMNHRPGVKGMNMVDIDMWEDMTVDVVKRYHKCVVLVKHWTGDGPKRHQ